MTTLVLFTQPANAAFQFTADLDGTPYLVVVTWSLFAQRYYVNVGTMQGEIVFTRPRIGSPPEKDISLTDGYFATTLIWRPSSGYFEVGD